MLSLATGFLAIIIPEKLASHELDASIGASGPHVSKYTESEPAETKQIPDIQGLWFYPDILDFGRFVKLAAGPLLIRAKARRFIGPNIGTETVSDITVNTMNNINGPAGSLQTADGQSLPAPATRAGTLLTDRLCQTPVAKRVKYYDRKCRGL